MTPPRVALVGLGNIGRTHAMALASSGVPVVAYVSRQPAAAPGLGLDSARHCSFADVLVDPDVDLVVDCGPSELHGQRALAALRAGKGIVVEKPLAVTAAEAAAVVAEATNTGLFGSVISQNRFEPRHLTIKRLLDEGALGQPLFATVDLGWWRDTDYYASADWKRLPGGGVLLNQAIHSVDLLLWWLGPAVGVCGFADRLLQPIEGEDTAVMALRFAGGALATVAATTANRPGSPTVTTLRTAKGTAILRHTDIVEWTFAHVAPPESGPLGTSGAADPAAIGMLGHVAQWRDIAEAWSSGRPPLVTLNDGLAAVAAIEAAAGLAGAGRPRSL